MDTVSSGELTLQEQINLLQKRMDRLEKLLSAKKVPAKRSPFTSEMQSQAEEQIMSILADLPDGKMVSARFISQKTALLRRMGVTKVRDYLEMYAKLSVLTKEGEGTAALYCVDRS